MFDFQGALPAAARVERATSRPRPRVRATAGTRFSAGEIIDNLEHNPDLVGSKWYGEPDTIGIAQQMMRDPQVRAAHNLRINPVLRADWAAIPAEDASDYDVECAKLLDQNLFHLLNWQAELRKIFWYKRDGFSLLEVTDAACPIDAAQYPLHPGNGRAVLITGLHHVPAWTVRGWVPKTGNRRQLDSIEQWKTERGMMLGTHKVTASKLLRFTEDQEGANFGGVAQWRSAYPPWMLKIKFLAIDAIKHDRYGIGMPFARQPKEGEGEVNEADVDAMDDILENIRANAKMYAQLPPGWDLSILTPELDMGTNIEIAIERCNRDIFANMGAGFAPLGDAKFGSFALAKVHDNHFALATECDANFIANVLMHGADGWSPVRRFVELNYPGAKMPRIVARNLPVYDYRGDIETLTKAAKVGLIARTETLSREILEKSDFTADGQEDAFAEAAKKAERIAARGEEQNGGNGNREDKEPADDD